MKLKLMVGGIRAALAARYLTSILKDDNFLDNVTYFAGLSGSSWFLSDWLCNKKIDDDVISAKENCRDYLADDFLNALENSPRLKWDQLKLSWNKDAIFTDLCLELWAQLLSKGYKIGYDIRYIEFSCLNRCRLSDQTVENMPWPLMTAVQPDKVRYSFKELVTTSKIPLVRIFTRPCM